MREEEVAPTAGAAEPARPWHRPVGPLGPVGPLLVLLALTAVGAWARGRGLTRLGLWRDDAWVALSARVGPRTAVRMSATTPGFTLILRSWLGLAAPTTSWWGPLLPLALGVLAPPALYLLARVHGLSTRLALLAAAAVTASPVAITYATRLKPYALDLLLACLLLGLAERVRRAPDRRALVALAAASVGAVLLSGSTAPVLAGTWAAVLLDGVARADRGDLRDRALAAAAATAGAGAVYVVFYRHLPPGIATTWHDYYLDLSSWAEAERTVALTAPRLLEGLAPVSASGVPWVAAGTLLAIVAGGLAAGRAAWAPALTVAASVAAAVLELAPLGTGRTDEVLYPALILLGALALGVAGRVASTLPPGLVAATARQGLASFATAALLLVAATATWHHVVRYPATDLRPLLAEVDHARTPDTLLVVEARTRYLWALTQEDDLDVVFGSQWLTGFTVASHRPGVFVQPSYAVEPGFTPTRWAEQAAGARRILYLSTPFEVATTTPDQAFLALLRAGWVPTHEVDAPGGRLVVLDRTTAATG